MIPLLAALCVGVLLGYVLCGLVHRAARDAERRAHADWLQRQLDALADGWLRYYTARGSARPRITHVAEMDEPIRRHHG